MAKNRISQRWNEELMRAADRPQRSHPSRERLYAQSHDDREWDRPGSNTLPPPEFPRRRVYVKINKKPGQAAVSRNILWEYAFYLLILALCIYGLYRLTIYLLNQS